MKTCRTYFYANIYFTFTICPSQSGYIIIIILIIIFVSCANNKKNKIWKCICSFTKKTKLISYYSFVKEFFNASVIVGWLFLLLNSWSVELRINSWRRRKTRGYYKGNRFSINFIRFELQMFVDHFLNSIAEWE